MNPPRLLRYTWRNKPGDRPALVTCLLERAGTGTRLTWDHTGFRGAGGFVMSRLLGRIRARMLEQGLPAVLATVRSAA